MALQECFSSGANQKEGSPNFDLPVTRLWILHDDLPLCLISLRRGEVPIALLLGTEWANAHNHPHSLFLVCHFDANRDCCCRSYLDVSSTIQISMLSSVCSWEDLGCRSSSPDTNNGARVTRGYPKRVFIV
jgi:hypothetical protein